MKQHNLTQRFALLGLTGLATTLVANGLLGYSAQAQPDLLQIEPITISQPVIEIDPLQPSVPVCCEEPSVAELQRFLIHFNDAYLVYEPGIPGIQIAAQNNVLSYGGDWEVVELKPYLFAFRQANWQGFYWKVNTSRQEVYRVTNGSFGELGGDEELLEMGVDTVGSPEAPERFFLEFNDAYLVRSNSGVLQIAAQSNVLSYGGDWEVVELQPYLFQLKQNIWKGFHWQVNTSRQIAERINGETFGEIGGDSRDDLDVSIEAVY